MKSIHEDQNTQTLKYNYYYYYLLKAYSPVNRTGSPQGFSLNQILQKLNTVQNMHISQVWKQGEKLLFQ